MKKTLAGLLAFIVLVSYTPERGGWLYAQDRTIRVGDPITLSWTPPTEGVDNQPLQELLGYRILESSVPGGPYTEIVDVAFGNTSYMVVAPSEGDHYYVATAYNSAGESDYSNEVWVSVSGLIVRPKAPGSLVAN